MNPLSDVLPNLLVDSIGIAGLGMLGLAAARLARHYGSWGGTMMALGAISLLLGRLYFISAPHVIDNNVLAAIGPVGIALTIAVPPLLVSGGLAGVVWGLWGHDRWLREMGG